MGYSAIVLSALTLVLPPDGGRSVTPVYRNGGLACLVAETKDEFLAIVNDDGCVPQVAAGVAGRRRTIFNLSFATFAFPDGLTVGPASAGGDGFDSIENNKPEGEHP